MAVTGTGWAANPINSRYKKMKPFLILLISGLSCMATAQKALMVQNLRWPEIQKIYVGQMVSYELHDDKGNRYTRKLLDVYPERNSVLLGELEVPLSEIKRITIHNHVGWGVFKKGRRWLSSYAGNPVFVEPKQGGVPRTEPAQVTLNMLVIGGKIITRDRNVRLGKKFRLTLGAVEVLSP